MPPIRCCRESTTLVVSNMGQTKLMKRLRIFAGTAALALFCTSAIAQQTCSRTQVVAEVGVDAGDLSLADLLSNDSCAEIRRAASKIYLGKAPLPGSAR